MDGNYDFSGWATRANRRCADGRTILPDAFKSDDGRSVPLVWNHQHDDPNNVLGHALLENHADGVRVYGYFNDTPRGLAAKEQVKHGDITALSIFANNLKQRGSDVVHGVIREVSLVLAGANPEAFIDTVLAHSDDYTAEEAIIYSGETLELSHSAKPARPIDAVDTGRKLAKEDETMAESKEQSDGEETVQDVVDSMTDKQRTVMYALIGQAIQDNGGRKSEDEEEESVKHNVFDSGDRRQGTFLSPDDMKVIFADAKRLGSLRDAVAHHMEDGGVLAHALDLTGMETATGTQTYGFNDPSMLFPDYKSLNNPPDWISREMGWVRKVMGAVHHTPFSRIKSVFANITEDEARARGYIKGRQKREEVFTTLKRTTDPQTIYKKQKMDRDDIIDITDFDVVQWIKAEMRIMLDEEIGRGILIGDGRSSDSDDKIQEIHVRPIATDVPLFNTKVRVEVAANADSGVRAKATINAAIRARKNYKGSGNPTFFTTEDVLTDMLLLEDGIGHKLYKTEAELATALRVREIVTVEPMENQTVADGNDTLPLIGIIVNLADYNVGADKGGEVNTFEDFDIDFNQQKYLIETRISGALVKPFSALTLLLDEAA